MGVSWARNSLEEGIVFLSSILALRITEEPGGLRSTGQIKELTQMKQLTQWELGGIAQGSSH